MTFTGARRGVATIYQRTALKTEKIYFCLKVCFLIRSRIILTRLYVSGTNKELWMKEMPPHVTLPLSGPDLDHLILTTVTSLVSDHPWCPREWSLTRGGRLREQSTK